jgi:hypothetical protein
MIEAESGRAGGSAYGAAWVGGLLVGLGAGGVFLLVTSSTADAADDPGVGGLLFPMLAVLFFAAALVGGVGVVLIQKGVGGRAGGRTAVFVLSVGTAGTLAVDATLPNGVGPLTLLLMIAPFPLALAVRQVDGLLRKAAIVLVFCAVLWPVRAMQEAVAYHDVPRGMLRSADFPHAHQLPLHVDGAQVRSGYRSDSAVVAWNEDPPADVGQLVVLPSDADPCAVLPLPSGDPGTPSGACIEERPDLWFRDFGEVGTGYVLKRDGVTTAVVASGFDRDELRRVVESEHQAPDGLWPTSSVGWSSPLWWLL